MEIGITDIIYNLGGNDIYSFASMDTVFNLNSYDVILFMGDNNIYDIYDKCKAYVRNGGYIVITNIFPLIDSIDVFEHEKMDIPQEIYDDRRTQFLLDLYCKGKEYILLNMNGGLLIIKENGDNNDKKLSRPTLVNCRFHYNSVFHFFDTETYYKSLIDKEHYHFRNKYEECDFPLDSNDKDKYVVVCVAKNEDDYIIEWIDHYLRYGFDKIIIGDNNDDQNKLKTILSDYIASGKVELFNCWGMSVFQDEFYTMHSMRGNYKWAGYFDCDEFLELTNYDNIKDYINSKNGQYDAIIFNWMMMSNDGHLIKQDGTVQERFPHPLMPLLNVKFNFNRKTLISGKKKFVFENPHIAFPLDTSSNYSYGGYGDANNNYKGQNSQDIKYKDGYVKHYSTKSFEECMGKVKRSYPDGASILNADIVFESCNPYPFLPSEDLFNKEITTEREPVRNYMDIIKDYEYIGIKHGEFCSSYALLQSILFLLSNVEGKTVILDKVDDTIFNIALGYSYFTTNTVKCSHNLDEYLQIVGNNGNYIISFF